jgi:sugar lactone lactonase YvrE
MHISLNTLRLIGIGGLFFGVVNVFAADQIRTIAGTGLPGYSGDNGAASAAALNRPTGMDIDLSGNLYVSDRYNHVIRKITPEGVISTFAGNGTAGFNIAPDAVASDLQFHYPMGVALDGNGRVYVADSDNQRIQIIDALGQRLTVFGDGNRGYDGDGGHASTARFQYPQALVIDADNSLYIADSLNHVVRKVSRNGIIQTVVGVGYAGYGGDNGHALNARLNLPNGLALDKAGNLYIADQFNHRVRRVSPDGVIETYAGNGQKGYSGDGGLAREASLDNPYALRLDSNGNLFISESGNHVVRKVDSQGIISTVAGTGLAGFSGDDGAATDARLNSPAGVAVGRNNGIYIADMNNHRLRLIDAYATPSTGHVLSVSRLGNGAGSISAPPGHDGSGIVCGHDCQESYEPGTRVNVRASPDAGARFLGWSGACSGTSLETFVVMDNSKSCSATFEYTNTLQFSHNTYRVMENAGVFSLSVMRDSLDPAAPLSVSYHFEDDSAYRIMGDYSADDGQLYWPAGAAGERTLYISIGDNPHVNSDRRFSVVLSNPSGGAILGENSHASVIIVNDDSITGGTPCPMDAAVNLTCNAIGVSLSNTLIGPDGHMTGGLLYGLLLNQGWSSNLRIMPTGVVSGGILLGDVSSQGIAGNFSFHGVLFSGGTLRGQINSGLGRFENVRLSADAVLRYGSVGGSVRGSGARPGVLEQLRIEEGAYLARVRLGAGVDYHPNTLNFGPGVENLSDARFAQLPAHAQSACYEDAPPPLNLKLALGAGLSAPLSIINALPFFAEIPGEMQQDAEQGILRLASGGHAYAAYPMALAHSARTRADWEFDEYRQQVDFHLGNNTRVIAHPALHAPCALEQALRLPVHLSVDGLAHVIANEDISYVARPDLAALPTAEGIGLWLNQNAALPGLVRAAYVFNSHDGIRRMQALHPAPVDLASIQRVAETVRFLDAGVLEFRLGSRNYRGIPDYVVTRARVSVPNHFRVYPWEDFNGDGITDYMLSYPDGRQQILFAAP